MEIWRDIHGFEGFYQVSNFGNIRSVDRYVGGSKQGLLKRLKGKIRKQSINPKTGYSIICLKKDGKKYMRLVHRIVAFAFPEICGEKFENCVIDHLDTNRTNNMATNLRVCTLSENMRNPISMVRLKENIRRACEAKKDLPAWNKGKLLPNNTGEKHWRSKPILQIDKEGNVINRWVNSRAAAMHFGVRPSLIYNCLTGRSNSSLGYIWKYE